MTKEEMEIYGQRGIGVPEQQGPEPIWHDKELVRQTGRLLPEVACHPPESKSLEASNG